MEYDTTSDYIDSPNNNSFEEKDENQKSDTPGSPKIIVVKPALQPEGTIYRTQFLSISKITHSF
jgi:hypothetical protein